MANLFDIIPSLYNILWFFFCLNMYVDNVVFTSILDVLFSMTGKILYNFEDFIKTELHDNVKCTSTHVTPLE